MLSIIIVNYKTSKDISTCLESIVRHENRYREYEIIIVDNNSNDPGLEALGSGFSFIKIINAPKNGGFAYGNNIGIKHAAGDCILLLNPDTYLEDNGIEKLYERLNNDPGLDIIGPKLLNADHTNQSISAPKTYLTPWNLFCSQFYLNILFKKSRTFNSYYQTYMDYDAERFVEQVSGAVFMFKRRIIDTIGLLDENYFLYYEESDYCLQAVKNGFTLLYYPGSSVVHTGHTSTSDIKEWSITIFIASFRYYFKKNFSPAAAYISIALLFLGSSVRCIIYLLTFNKNYKHYYCLIKNIITAMLPKNIG